MEDDEVTETTETQEEEWSDQGGDGSEEGFHKGYSEEEKVLECAECGTAVREEKKLVKQIEGEEYTFCSAVCAKEFEESMGEG